MEEKSSCRRNYSRRSGYDGKGLYWDLEALLEKYGLGGLEEYNIGKVFFSWVVGKLVIND